MVEVVVEIGLGLDETERDAFAQLEVRLTFAPALDREPVGKPGQRLREVAHTQRDMLDRAALPWSVGREQGQLPAPGVRADERERVGPVDHVHPEMPDGEVRQGVAIREPVGDVVERERSHVAGSAIRSARCGRRSRRRTSR